MELEIFANLRDKTILVGGDHHAHATSEKAYTYLQEQAVKSRLVKYDDSCSDYIYQTQLVAREVSKDPINYAGIIGCRNGFATTILSNKYPYVFAVRCDTPQEAAIAREVNYCNVLTFGSDFVDESKLNKIIEVWLNTNFEINEKNRGRLARILLLEQQYRHNDTPLLRG